jgi:NADH:ubiquinone oxidoreductase subunit K
MIYNFVIDLSIMLSVLGAFGIIVNKRYLLLSVICIERRIFGLNLLQVTLALSLDDIRGEIFALFILGLAAAESAIALSLVRAYFRLYGSIRVREQSSREVYPQRYQLTTEKGYIVDNRGSKKKV